MQLKNKKDGRVYHVRTEEDGSSGFMIFALSGDMDTTDFCMHYCSLKDFNDEWEEIEDD